MTGPEIWLNGRFVAAEDAVVSVFDRGFRTGEGVFETFRSYGGHVFRLDAHLDRAYDGAATLGFTPPDRDQVRAAVTATAQRRHERVPGDAVLRLTMTPGRIDPSTAFPGRPVGDPTVVVSAHPLEVDPSIHEHGVAVATVPYARELPHVKAVSYLAASLARAQARAAGAAEALLTDGDHVLEGAGSNVFVVREGTLLTPPVDQGILDGVTRRVVLEVARAGGVPVTERALTLDEVKGADEVFLTATTREVVPVVRVDGDRVGSGRPGDLTRTVHDRYRHEVQREAAAR